MQLKMIKITYPEAIFLNGIYFRTPVTFEYYDEEAIEHIKRECIQKGYRFEMRDVTSEILQQDTQKEQPKKEEPKQQKQQQVQQQAQQQKQQNGDKKNQKKQQGVEQVEKVFQQQENTQEQKVEEQKSEEQKQEEQKEQKPEEITVSDHVETSDKT